MKIVAKWLSATSPKAWEATGTAFGLFACSAIVSQIYQEWRSSLPSSLSTYYLVGFAIIYLYWFAYGVRFGHVGVWLPNMVAALLQIVLAAMILWQRVGNTTL